MYVWKPANGALADRWSGYRTRSLPPASPWQSQEEKLFFSIKSHKHLNCFVKAPSMWHTLHRLTALHFSSSYGFMDISVGKKTFIRQTESPTAAFCSVYVEVASPSIKESPIQTEFIYLPGIERQIQ